MKTLSYTMGVAMARQFKRPGMELDMDLRPSFVHHVSGELYVR